MASQYLTEVRTNHFSFHGINIIVVLFSVPTFINLPEDTLIKIADVLEEVSNN